MSPSGRTQSSDVAVVYARYSSLAQRDVSIDDQVAECRRYAEAHGLRVAHVYADRAMSGRTDARPQLQEMLADSEAGVFSTVLVYKLDRFARNRADAATHRRELERRGVALVSVTEPVPEGPNGIILAGMVEAFAEYYSANLSVQVLRGMRGNADRCMTNGLKVYGYREGRDGRYEVDEAEAALVVRMFELYVGGWKAERVGGWMAARGATTRIGTPASGPWVLDRIHDERYVGVYHWDDRRVEGGMPQIVDRSLWDAAQSRRRPSDSTRKSHAYPLSGRMVDAGTGAGMYGYSARGKSGRSYSYYAVDLGGGRRATVRSSDVDSAVAGAVLSLLSDPDVASEVADRAVEYARSLADSPEVSSARRRLSELSEAEGNLVRAVERGMDLEGIGERLSEIREERSSLEARVAEAEEAVPSREEVLDALSSLPGSVSDAELIENVVEGVSLNRATGTAEVSIRLHGRTPSEAVGTASSEGVRAKVKWWTATPRGSNTSLRLGLVPGSLIIAVRVA